MAYVSIHIKRFNVIKSFFFDRDGVLIKNYGYFCNKNKIKWLKGAIEAIKILNKKKIKVIMVTNQSGVARGYFTENELRNFHKTMVNQLSIKKAKIDKIYYCPFHPNAKIKKYKKNSKFRKPNNGMLISAIKKYKLRTRECFMIGDNISDYMCAKKSQIFFEYKKNYSLDKQILKILKKLNKF